MAIKRAPKRSTGFDWSCCMEKKILIGALIFLVGLLKYLELGWPEILMIVGVLIILKGILIKK